MLSFDFNNRNSYDDFGIILQSRPTIPAPERNVEYIKVPGKSGALTIDYKTYNNITIPIKCQLRKYNYQVIEDIKSWLSCGKDMLVFNDNIDKCYKAQCVNPYSIDKLGKTFGEFTINFTCEPFLYSDYDESF